jgi:hypothetical protein
VEDKEILFGPAKYLGLYLGRLKDEDYVVCGRKVRERFGVGKEVKSTRQSPKKEAMRR